MSEQPEWNPEQPEPKYRVRYRRTGESAWMVHHYASSFQVDDTGTLRLLVDDSVVGALARGAWAEVTLVHPTCDVTEVPASSFTSAHPPGRGVRPVTRARVALLLAALVLGGVLAAVL